MSALPAFRLVVSEDDLPDSPPPGPALTDLLDRYLSVHPALTPKAIEQYRVAVNLAGRWLREAGKPDSCDELFSLPKFCDWFKWLAPGRKPKTINGRIKTLWMLWSFAHDDRLCAAPLPPPKKKPLAKEPKNDPVAFTHDEIIILLAATMHAAPMARLAWWKPDHWTTLVGAFLATAERLEALLQCPRSALSGNVLLVPAHLTKDKKETPVVLPQWLAEKIRRLPPVEGSDRIWPYPFGLKQLGRRYEIDILKPAGLPTSRKHKFHALRRSAITQVMIAHGLEEASKMARHFGSGLTLKSYVSQTVVQQQTGSVTFDVPAPAKRTSQLKLF
jgi:hypothetical protein